MKAHTSSNGFARFLKNSFIGLLVAGTVAITSTLYAAAPTTGDDWNIGADQTLQDGWGLITSKTTTTEFDFDPAKTWNGIIPSFTSSVKPLLPSDQTPIFTYAYKLKDAADDTYEVFDNTIINAGLYTVQISASAPNFTLDPTTVDITVKPLEITSPIIALSSTTGVYTGSAFTLPTAIVKTAEGGTEISNATTWTTAGDDVINAGTYSVTITASEGQNYTFDPATASFVITPKSIVVASTGSATAVYGSASATDGITFSTSDAVAGETITFENSNDYKIFTSNVANGFTVTASLGTADVNKNYTIASGNTVAGTVTQADATLAFTAPTVTFGDAAPVVSVAVSGVQGDAATLIATATADYAPFTTGAGTYTVTASDLVGTGAENYKLPAIVTATGTVNQADALIAISTPDIVFGTATADPVITATASKLAGDVSSADMTVELTKGYTQYTSTVATGYTATVTAINGNANYKLPTVNFAQLGSVTPAPLSVACTPTSIEYGTAVAPTQTVTATGLEGESFSVAFTTDYTQFTSDIASGFKVIVAASAVIDPENGNYAIATEQEFGGIITPKAVTIAYNETTATTNYGQLATIPTPVITGIVNSDEVTVTVTPPTSAYEQASVVGDYVWTATTTLTGTSAGNYTGSIDAGKETYTLTVGKATLVAGTPTAVSAKSGVALSTVSIPATTVTVNDDYVIAGTWAWDSPTDVLSGFPVDKSATFTPTAAAENFVNPTISVTITINLSSDITPVDGKIFVAETGTGNGSTALTPAPIAEAIAYIIVNAGTVNGLNIVGDITTAIDATTLNVALVGMPQASAKTVKITNITTDTEITGLVITGEATFATGATLDKCTVVGATTGVVAAGSTVFFPVNSVIQAATITITEGKKIATVDEDQKGTIKDNTLYLSSDNADDFGPKFTDPTAGDFSLNSKSVLINRGKN